MMQEILQWDEAKHQPLCPNLCSVQIRVDVADELYKSVCRKNHSFFRYSAGFVFIRRIAWDRTLANTTNKTNIAERI